MAFRGWECMWLLHGEMQRMKVVRDKKDGRVGIESRQNNSNDLLRSSANSTGTEKTKMEYNPLIDKL